MTALALRVLLSALAETGSAPERQGASRQPAGKVSLGEIESQIRSITGAASETLGLGKSVVTTAGAAIVGGALAIAGAYLYGKRRGRRRATVIEIRRV